MWADTHDPFRLQEGFKRKPQVLDDKNVDEEDECR